MGEIRIVGPGKTRGYPYPVCKKLTFLAGSKYLLPSVKVGSKLTYLVAKFGGHITAHLPSVQVVVRF